MNFQTHTSPHTIPSTQISSDMFNIDHFNLRQSLDKNMNESEEETAYQGDQSDLKKKEFEDKVPFKSRSSSHIPFGKEEDSSNPGIFSEDDARFTELLNEDSEEIEDNEGELIEEECYGEDIEDEKCTCFIPFDNYLKKRPCKYKRIKFTCHHPILKNFHGNEIQEPYTITYDFKYLNSTTQRSLLEITRKLLTFGKGILCIDETISVIGKRLKSINISNTEDNRRKYREILLTADAIYKHFSGVIFADETIKQTTSEGIPFTEILNKRQILKGIKLDQGQVPLYWSKNESTTIGLDNLSKRCLHYKNLGCTFAVWHCVFKIGDQTPSYQSIHENARILARYAATCQSHAIVPIVEPEILSDGDHDIIKAQQTTETIIAVIVKAFNDYNVFLEGTILKLNMVTYGAQYSDTYASQIPETTVIALQRTIPPAIPGIIFVPGVQSTKEFAKNLALICKLKDHRAPWAMTFSFGRHFQEPIMQTWSGKDERILLAQKEFLKHIECLSRVTHVHQFESLNVPKRCVRLRK